MFLLVGRPSMTVLGQRWASAYHFEYPPVISKKNFVPLFFLVRFWEGISMDPLERAANVLHTAVRLTSTPMRNNLSLSLGNESCGPLIY